MTEAQVALSPVPRWSTIPHANHFPAIGGASQLVVISDVRIPSVTEVNKHLLAITRTDRAKLASRTLAQISSQPRSFLCRRDIRNAVWRELTNECCSLSQNDPLNLGYTAIVNGPVTFTFGLRDGQK